MYTFQTARTLAGQTGGEFFGNQLPSAADDMNRIDDSTRFQYLLGYYPAKATLDNRFRRIEVRVNRPGATVLFRHGYYARAEPAPFDRQRLMTLGRMMGAADFNQEIHDIRLEAKASMSPASHDAPLSVTVDMSLDPSRIAFTKANGRNTASVEVASFCLDGGDHPLGQVWQTMELTYSDDRLDAAKRDGISYKVTIPVRDQAKRVKIVVYDYDADLVGSAIVKVVQTR
jgi:hypothetical protein